MFVFYQYINHYYELIKNINKSNIGKREKLLRLGFFIYDIYIEKKNCFN